MMDDKKIVKMFLDNGYQLSGDAIPLVRSNPTQILERLGELKTRPLIITGHHIKKITTKPKKFKILKEFVPEKEPIKIDDYTKHILLKYDKIRNMFLKRFKKKKLISIANISPRTSKFSIIAAVKKKIDDELTLEDPTGTLNVTFNEKKFSDVQQDDVVLVSCEKKGNKIRAENMFWPDIPINREVAKSKIESKIAIIPESFLSDNQKTKNFLKWVSDVKNVTNVFIFANNKKILPKEFLSFNTAVIGTGNDSNMGTLIENSATLEVNNIKILLLTTDLVQNMGSGITTKNILSALKRRHLLPHFNQILSVTDDLFVLDDVPDVVITRTDEDTHSNYKGTTIISISAPNKAKLLNLKTREVSEKEFD